jgi:GATA-binding protein
MSALQYAERGGHMRPSPPAVNSPDTVHSTALSSPRSTVNPLHSSSASSSTIQSLATSGTLDSKLDSSPTHDAIRTGVLRDSLFPTWKDDAAGAEIDDLEDMQRKDPLATQVWKLFSRAKTQLPNAERMENLTWRMMSVNMKKLELERQRWVFARDRRVHVLCSALIDLIECPPGKLLPRRYPRPAESPD